MRQQDRTDLLERVESITESLAGVAELSQRFDALRERVCTITSYMDSERQELVDNGKDTSVLEERCVTTDR